MTVLECLCSHFPHVDKQVWIERFNKARILNAEGNPLLLDHPYHPGLRIHYFREVENEVRIPFYERIIHVDNHLLVADKPHFLPVMPAGRYVRETLQSRLTLRFPHLNLTPLHRIDRHTAGLVMFSCNPESRGQYQRLFRERKIEKHYQAIAPALDGMTFPFSYRSRLQAGDPFFRMEETSGEVNTETHVDVLARQGNLWRYALLPVTGKKHQLRVHMTSLGAPICNDVFYPLLVDDDRDDYARPLKLLAQRLRFTDPLTGTVRCFESTLSLDWPTDSMADR